MSSFSRGTQSPPKKLGEKGTTGRPSFEDDESVCHAETPGSPPRYKTGDTKLGFQTSDLPPQNKEKRKQRFWKSTSSFFLSFAAFRSVPFRWVIARLLPIVPDPDRQILEPLLVSELPHPGEGGR